jgi:hypothetical protein
VVPGRVDDAPEISVPVHVGVPDLVGTRVQADGC